MTAELNMDGRMIFDDQVSELIDLLMNVRGVAMVYRMEERISWIRAVGEPGLRVSLGKLDDRQRKLIEDMVFERKTGYEIMKKLGMEDETFYDELADLRMILGESV